MHKKFNFEILKPKYSKSSMRKLQKISPVFKTLSHIPTPSVEHREVT